MTRTLTVEEAVRSVFGEDTGIAGKRPVSGGDINDAFLLDLTDGRQVFLKTNRKETADMFSAEEEGLKALAASGGIQAAKPLLSGCDPEADCAFLLLEYIREGKRTSSFWDGFGRALACLHRQETGTLVPGGIYGFFRDTYIGRNLQRNRPHDSWIPFFRDERLKVQFDMAGHWFDTQDRKRIGDLLADLDRFLIEPERPSLLHGDLWAGNFLAGRNGEAVLIDPAVYVGCAEADLAMTELFGGFSPRFYDAYREVHPVPYGYRDRRDLYNLYHLLNHLNLFGGGYLAPVKQILYRYT